MKILLILNRKTSYTNIVQVSSSSQQTFVANRGERANDNPRNSGTSNRFVLDHNVHVLVESLFVVIEDIESQGLLLIQRSIKNSIPMSNDNVAKYLHNRCFSQHPRK
ncbi:2103_t:CDS:2 [Paraglomus brasilianum]|uniref:2103_t:CDS:1 n=1 Tax=Paraglomus brasilianum TaxID=144538 RepID=A0A9N9A0I5_9GLOM|nr:2103_t:CDS:2 [Paraglomus brasilianum]